jgi:hypothetical protein
MERLTRCLVWLGAFAFVGSCSGDPTDSSRTPTDIVADPAVVFVVQGDSQTVDLRVVDEQGQPLPGEFAITTPPSAAATVTPDPTFLSVIAGDPIGTTARYFVKGNELGATSFVVSASGIEETIRVEVVPGNLAATFSSVTPALADTVTVTAPVGTSFSQTATIAVPPVPGGQGASNLTITERAPDGSFFKFIVSPNRSGAATITGVTVTSNPNLTFTLQTTETITSPVIASVAGSFSNPTPPLGQAVTFTLPAGLKTTATPATAVTVQGNAVAPANVVIAADSGSITFVPPPSSDSALTLNGIVAAERPEYPMTLTSTTKVTTPVISTIAATFSNAAPAIAQPVTLTAPAGFTFTSAATPPAPNSNVSFSGLNAIIQARTATSITFIPLPGSTGAATVTGVIPDAAPMFSLTLPTTNTITVPPLVPLRFTEDPAHAPAFPIPAAGQDTTIFEAGAYHGPGDCCFEGPTRLYRLTLDATMTLTGTIDWFEGQDLGLYWVAADGVTPVGNFDGDAQGAGGHPETSTVTLAAGSYFLAVANFSATDPSLFSITLERAP